MKKFIGLVIIVAALILGSYYGMGYLTERKVKEDLQLVNQSNSLSVQIENYQRGWFTSQVLLNWHLQIPEHEITTPEGKPKIVPAEDYKLKMPITIHHGPIIFADRTVKFGFGYAHTEMILPTDMAEQFKNTFTADSTQPKLELSVLVSYLNHTNIDASIPEFKLISKNANGGQLDWLGITSATNVSSNLDKVSGNITLEGLRYSTDKIKMVLSTVTSEYNLHKAPNGIYLGDASLSFPSLNVTSGTQKMLELNQFDVHSDTSIEGGLFNSRFKVSLEKMVVNDKSYGPGVLDVGIKNLDADALAKINDQVNQMQQGNEQQNQQAMLAILPQLPQLFSKGAEFEISELAFTMPEGKIECTLLLALPKAEASNPIELIQKLQGNGKLRMPAAIVKNILIQFYQQKLSTPASQQTQNIQQGIVQQMQKQAAGQETKPNAPNASQPAAKPAEPTAANPADQAQQAAALADKQIAAMIQSGLLVQQGNDYLIEMTYNQSKLTVNGKPFDPAMLKMQ